MCLKMGEGKGWLDRGSYRKKVLAGPEKLGENRIVQIVEVKPGQHVEPHKHGITEEVFVLQSSVGYLKVGGIEVEAVKDKVVLCEPGTVHEVFNPSEKPLRILVFKNNVEENDTEWV